MNMGIGRLGGANLIIKKKYLWTFQVINLCNGMKISESFVKSMSRPSWDTDETELNFLNAKTYIPGKTTLETLTVTYIDVATVDQQPLWSWLASVYNYNDPVKMHSASKRSDYSGTGILVMYDTTGTPLEQWVMIDCWPKGVNFGDLSMEDSEPAEIELTLRYSAIKYTSLCPTYTPYGCFSACGNEGNGGAGSTFIA